MKQGRYFVAIVILALTMALPSKALAQSWWEGFANAQQPNSFWDWLQQYPEIAGPLQQNPYQVYDPDWRAQHPEFQQYVNNNPGWWNGVLSSGPQYYDPAFNQFLSTHPTIARDLLKNPELIYNPSYLAKHPQLKAFLASHKATWQPTRKQTYSYSPRGGWGTYDNKGEWRDETWWKENGDWDDQHKWHDSDWWKQNNRVRAERHHPNWFINQPATKHGKHQGAHGPDKSPE